MSFFKKNRYKNLKREDVIDSICELEKQENDLEMSIVDISKNIDDLLQKGKNEKSKDLQILWAKKITALKEDKETAIKRCIYLLYNIKLAKRLKDAIDDNQFILNTGKVSIKNLLQDQKGLAKFLNKALNTKVKDEQILTSADEVFNEVQSGYIENESIYGIQKNDDALLAMFETAESLEDDQTSNEKNLENDTYQKDSY